MFDPVLIWQPKNSGVRRSYVGPSIQLDSLPHCIHSHLPVLHISYSHPFPPERLKPQITLSV